MRQLRVSTLRTIRLAVIVIAALALVRFAVQATRGSIQRLPLRVSAQASSTEKSVPGEILVRFRPDSQIALNRSHSTRVTTTKGQSVSVELHELPGAEEIVPGLRLVKSTPDQQTTLLVALNSRDDVLYAEPNYIWHRESTTPNDEFFEFQWGISGIEANIVWDTTTGNSNLVVGVVDGGMDIGENHELIRDANIVSIG